MARARNIKPGFFTHEQMAENDPLGRLLFLGLTTIADYKGELEWRPKRIKIQLLPYDECDIGKLAINLDKSGFVRFYSDGDKIYLKIVNFDKHQNPHKNEREAGSEIPNYSDEMRQAIDIKALTIIRDLSGSDQDKDGTAPADSLIPYPSSLIPHPDSREDDSQASVQPKVRRKTRLPSDFALTAERIDAAENYWASKNRSDLSAIEEFEKFVAHHRSHGETYLDWDATWKTWYCNAPKFNKPPLTAIQGGAPRVAGQARDFKQIDYTEGVSDDGRF